MATSIRILIFGNKEWISNLNDEVFSHLNSEYSLEKITDLEAAKIRLTHNSYDVLIIKERI